MGLFTKADDPDRFYSQGKLASLYDVDPVQIGDAPPAAGVGAAPTAPIAQAPLPVPGLMNLYGTQDTKKTQQYGPYKFDFGP